MAKLDNVKVVNETVEYNGFVYELTNEGAQQGDFIQCLEDDAVDLTYGAFYQVISTDDYNDMQFLDDDNDERDRSVNDEEYKVFRKSHEVSIDKLTDAEGVVTITLPDGTKLEGTPSDLEKITRSMQALQAEQVETVEMPEEAVEVEEASEPVAECLQVGDYAKVIQQGHENFGYITKITNNNRDSHLYPFATELLNGESGDIHSEDQLLKATDEEVLEAKQALLKEGDFARVISNEATTEACSPHEFEIDAVLKLHEFDSDDNTFETRYLNGDTPDAEWVHRQDLEPLTEEEVEHIVREAEEEKKAKAECEKWAAIGREVGELRDGDVVQFTESTGTSEFPEDSVAIITNVSGDEFNFGEDDVYDGDSAWVKLIVPVEQRFDTVG
ncbi:hypothetical protein [Bacillus wiedmannii]|uniref:hypothetical protein n=1 Tax=Bacillus wiedmannii TaxID=1890302 RepID=UPI0007CAFE86|nr:hypothetical protein [Bacillus wiedmannii]OAK36254.1 hypothetical protein A6284_26070 [Bacillus wiedmannii]HDR7641334.1 hypothetical protein [Bacillus wiedmannii]